MREQKPRTIEIRQYIVDHVESHPSDIAAATAERFGISSQAAGYHIRHLTEAGVLQSKGATKARRYTLRPIARVEFRRPIFEGLAEDTIWTEEIAPKFGGIPNNVYDACHYGFTEMVNNVIDHSESESLEVSLLYTAQGIRMKVRDFGVGIFRKIQREFNLADERHAVLELAKGKLTTDPERHTGEGVFFTSRMFDIFDMWSGKLFFTHFIEGGSDWLIDAREELKGTLVSMSIGVTCPRSISDLYDQYTNTPEEMTFSKTHVPITLAQFGRDKLVSRSQAKRVLSRFELFEKVVLDFRGIDFIGQAFADEVFRVYQIAHPKVDLVAINSSPQVHGVITKAIEARREQVRDSR